ncbi:GIY-YIG nuclease family protein [Streptomyces sp. NPDC048638]|uniref:GIY-YIG nuclease family protein n=1 Tax=Streptomyces sp. NPDC048638 TaxID=3365580 RepID=UPI003719F0CF
MHMDLVIKVLHISGLVPALREHFEGVPDAPQQFTQGAIRPGAPGVYVWTDPRGAVLYIGCTVCLSARIGDQEGWVDEYIPAERWTLSVIHMFKEHHAQVSWVETTDHEEALELERLLIEWHRAETGVAPPAVGWDCKPGSRRERAQLRAQALWRRLHEVEARFP